MGALNSVRSQNPQSVILRSLPAVAVLGIGFSLLCIVQLTEFSFSGKPTRDFVWIIGATELAIYVWMRTYSAVSFRSQVFVLAILYGLQLCLYAAVEVEGFMGDGRPILVWRWNSSVRQKWLNHEPTVDRIHDSKVADFHTTTDFDSPAFRGLNRNGHAPNAPLARKWSNPPRQIWRKPIGLGWSSFSVVGEFCLTQEQRDERECVVCYELLTGQEMWCHSDIACFDEVTSGKGPRATPTIDEGRVYALGATGILNCLSGEDGELLWKTNVLQDANTQNALFGMSGSPLIVGELVVVCPGGVDASVVAYDKVSGRKVWAGGKAGASYSSPQSAKIGGETQILNFNAEGLYGHAEKSGNVLWKFPWVSNPSEKNNVGQPIVFADPNQQETRIFISSGYGKGSTLLGISERGGTFDVRQIWENRNLKAKFSSAVSQGAYIYGLDDRILVCIDVETGDRRWKRGRYGYGQLVLAGELLVIQAESGEIALVEAVPDGHHELARFAALSDRTWNHPVVSGNILLVRNDREAACFELPLAP